MQDIIRPKKSLKEILPSKNEPRMSSGRDQASAMPPLQMMNGDNPIKEIYHYQPQAGYLKGLLLTSGIALILVFSYFVSLAFTRATVEVLARERSFPAGGEIEAWRQSDNGQQLTFGYSEGLSETIKVPVSASGVEKVSRLASGKIIIHNSYSSTKQTLIKNTRFEAPNGKIYRIQEAVTVPGYRQEADGKIIPGTLEVVVKADQPGAEYNLSSGNFTIPGFKNGPQFEKITATLKEAISGGLVGEEPKISEADANRAEAQAQKTLSEQISKKIKSNLPDNVILFDDGLTFNFETLSPEIKDGQTYLVVKANAVAVVFDKKKLSQFLAKRWLNNYDGGEVLLSDFSQLDIKFLNKEEINSSFAGPLKISVAKKDLNIKWVFDESALIEAIKNISNSEMVIVLRQFPAIENARINFSPPWSNNVPNKTERIKIKLVGPEDFNR